MLPVFGLMLLMLQMISCVDQTCSFNQTEICNAALGHKLSLQMILDLKLYDADIKHLKTGDTTADPTCRIRNDQMKVNSCDLYKNRSDVLISNGVVIINHVIREDSGRYTLLLMDSTGRQTHKVHLHVNVEAPIGSVNVSVICGDGERRVFCSSDGDELVFSWTLDGRPQAERTNIIVLDKETSGNISCGVKNNVSHGEKTITLNYCTESTTVSVTSALTDSTLVLGHGTSLSDSNLTCTQKSEELPSLWMFTADVLIVLGCVTVILIVLFVTVYHIYKRKKHHKSTAAAQDCAELTYADINHVKPNRNNPVKKADVSPAVDVEYAAVGPQTKKRERKEKKDEELQYGELTFTPDKSNIQQRKHQRRCEEQDECVYSQVQTHNLKH